MPRLSSHFKDWLQVNGFTKEDLNKISQHQDNHPATRHTPLTYAFSRFGWTPLMWAAHSGSKKVLGQLLAADGIQDELCTPDTKKTAFQIALKNLRVQSFRLWTLKMRYF